MEVITGLLKVTGAGAGAEEKEEAGAGAEEKEGAGRENEGAGAEAGREGLDGRRTLRNGLNRPTIEAKLLNPEKNP